MTLTTNAKNWLATNAGVHNCFSSTDVSFNMPGTGTLVGGTADVVTTFSVVGTYGTSTQKNEAIIATTSYNMFKNDINGGNVVDSSGDVMWVADRDGHAGAPQSLYCAQSVLGSITITPTTPSVQVGATQQLTAVCIDQYGTINCPALTWSSDSAHATVNTLGLVTAVSEGTAHISCTGGGLISNISTVTVTTPPTPADIVATAIVPGVTTCVAPCNTTVDITWTNNGGTDGTFVPTITINGTPTSFESQSLGAGLNTTKTFTLTNLLAGSHSICANPNTLPCVPIVVNASASFTSDPTAASVFIDGAETSPGTTPLTVPNLPVGNHTYRMTHTGCDNVATGNFTIATGLENVIVPLITFDTTATFASTPPGARIWIDGVDTGVDTPNDVIGLTVDTHTYILKKPGHLDATGQFITTICQRTEVPSVNLLPHAAEAGFGPILVGGLIIGALLMGKDKSSDVGRKGKVESLTIKQIRESPTRESPTQMSKTKSAQVSRSNISNN